MAMVVSVYFKLHVDLRILGALPRDDAGPVDSNRNGPKKRLAYETGTLEESERTGNTLKFASHRARVNETFEALGCVVNLEELEFWRVSRCDRGRLQQQFK